MATNGECMQAHRDNFDRLMRTVSRIKDGSDSKQSLRSAIWLAHSLRCIVASEQLEGLASELGKVSDVLFRLQRAEGKEEVAGIRLSLDKALMDVTWPS